MKNKFFFNYGFLILHLLFLISPFNIFAQDQSSAIMIIDHEGSNESEEILRIIDFANEALERAFSEVGINTINRIRDSNSSLEKADEESLKADVRWALVVYTSSNNSQFSWNFIVYDAVNKTIRGSDSFSTVVFVGILSQNIVTESAQKVASTWQNSFMFQEYDGSIATTQVQRFTSSQTGIKVYYGDESGVYLGEIKKDVLVAPFFLFTEGKSVYGTLTKEGYWTKHFTLPKGISEDTFQLPPLQKITRYTFGFNYEMQGGSQYALAFEYRYNFLPDRFFIALEWLFWLDSEANSERFKSHEGRLSPAFYLLPRRDSAFRLLAGISVSLVIPNGDFPALFFYPFWLGLEYNFPRFSINASFRMPLLLDNNAWYYTIPYDAWQVNSTGFRASFGVKLKW